MSSTKDTFFVAFITSQMSISCGEFMGEGGAWWAIAPNSNFFGVVNLTHVLGFLRSEVNWHNKKTGGGKSYRKNFKKCVPWAPKS